VRSFPQERFRKDGKSSRKNREKHKKTNHFGEQPPPMKWFCEEENNDEAGNIVCKIKSRLSLKPKALLMVEDSMRATSFVLPKQDVQSQRRLAGMHFPAISMQGRPASYRLDMSSAIFRAIAVIFCESAFLRAVASMAFLLCATGGRPCCRFPRRVHRLLASFARSLVKCEGLGDFVIRHANNYRFPDGQYKAAPIPDLRALFQ
jgi:hypothetical protein